MDYSMTAHLINRSTFANYQMLVQPVTKLSPLKMIFLSYNTLTGKPAKFWFNICYAAMFLCLCQWLCDQLHSVDMWHQYFTLDFIATANVLAFSLRNEIYIYACAINKFYCVAKCQNTPVTFSCGSVLNLKRMHDNSFLQIILTLLYFRTFDMITCCYWT